jgi:uncharacterized coiled-coil DUF342 family protein
MSKTDITALEQQVAELKAELDALRLVAEELNKKQDEAFAVYQALSQQQQEAFDRYNEIANLSDEASLKATKAFDAFFIAQSLLHDANLARIRENKVQLAQFRERKEEGDEFN